MVQLEDKTYQDLLTTQKAQAEENLLLKAEVAWYREQLGLAKKRLYAPKSEQSPVVQDGYPLAGDAL